VIYKVDFTPQAFEDISRLDKTIAERFHSPQPLKGRFQGMLNIKDHPEKRNNQYNVMSMK